MELTQSQISEIISNYTSSSKGFITLQSLIMNSLMGHERDLFVKANEHKQCNGLRSRRWYSHAFEFSLRIPRSRSGNFYLVFSGLIRSESKEHARFPTCFTQRSYSGQIDGNSEAIYGHIYSKQQVSYLSNSYREDVE
ncbi:MAG: transposase [Prevotella nigrescens]|uniref:Transposase n=1 Tax=Prevotella nigrescens TaxID=28133 RepID=A0A9D6ABA4_9BACT|nr:transposase [Prevotella nigrescens]